MKEKLFHVRWCFHKYSNATRRLTMLQHGAYIQLLSYYYEGKAAIPKSQVSRAAFAESAAEKAAVKFVLENFFTLEADGCYHNPKADEEIARAVNLSETNARCGKKGGETKANNIAKKVANAIPNATEIASENGEKNVAKKVANPETNNPEPRYQNPEPSSDDIPPNKLGGGVGEPRRTWDHVASEALRLCEQAGRPELGKLMAGWFAYRKRCSHKPVLKPESVVIGVKRTLSFTDSAVGEAMEIAMANGWSSFHAKGDKARASGDPSRTMDEIDRMLGEDRDAA